MMIKRTTYKLAIATAVGTALFLFWLSNAVGINGPDGEPFDRIYIGVLLIAAVGACLARLRPYGMAQALLATAAAQAIVPMVAIAQGKHHSGVSPALEIIGVNGIFVALFLLSAWLFWRSAKLSS